MINISYCENDFHISEQFVKITLGLDQLYKKEIELSNGSSLARESIIPVNLTSLIPKKYATYEKVIKDYNDLYERVNTIQNEHRREYMAKQINGMINFIHYLQKPLLSYRKIVNQLLFVDSNPIFHNRIQKIREKLKDKLKTANYSGCLEEMFYQWFNERKVERSNLEGTLQKLMNLAQEEVANNMFPEVRRLQVRPKVVTNVQYSAYADYESMEMIINGDYDYTYEELKHLVAHEVFPGHFTHLLLREIAIKNNEVPQDAGLVITNSASSPNFEGIADCGLYFLDWYSTKDDEIAKLYHELKMVTTLNAGYLLNELELNDDEITIYLKKYAFGQTEWINSRIAFLKDFLRGPFIYSYYRGFESLFSVYEKVKKEEMNQFYEILYKNMLTADELKVF